MPKQGYLDIESHDPFSVPQLPEEPVNNRETYFSIAQKYLTNPRNFFKEIGAKLMYERSPFAEEIRKKPGGWRTLHRIYLNEPETWMDKTLLGLKATLGTQERGDEFRRLLNESLIELYESGVEEPHVLDLGAGSGIIPTEVIYNAKNNGTGPDISLTLVDKNSDAKKYGEMIAQKNKLSGNVEYKRYNVKRVSDKENTPYHIVSTNGLLDYFNDDDAIDLFRNIGKVLAPGGKLITSNMTRHSDWIARYLMEFFGGWKLNYRTPDEFASMLKKSDCYDDIDAYLLPMEFHVIGIGKKKPEHEDTKTDIFDVDVKKSELYQEPGTIIN